jgi:hypothetical protein
MPFARMAIAVTQTARAIVQRKGDNRPMTQRSI